MSQRNSSNKDLLSTEETKGMTFDNINYESLTGQLVCTKLTLRSQAQRRKL